MANWRFIKKLNLWHLGFLLTGLLTCPVLPLNAETTPSFYAPFDGDAIAVKADKEIAEPVTERGLEYVPGVNGQAVYLGKHGQWPYEQMPLLEYDAEELFTGDGGTVMFWVSPDWDGYFTDPINFDTYFLFAAMGGRDVPDYTTRDVPPDSGCDRIWLFMWNWLRCDMYEEPGKPLASSAWRCRYTWMRGDWWHVAFTWSNDGWSKLYVNGVPQVMKATANIADIQRFYVGSLPQVWTREKRANAAFDELNIYQRALTDEEIAAEFTHIAPVDFSIERRYLRADETEKLEIDLVSGSHVKLPVTGTLGVRILADSDGSCIAEKEFNLSLSSRQTIEIPVGKLSVGAYRAECTLTRNDGQFRRSFPLTVYEQQEAPVTSREDVKLGEKILSLDLTQADNGFMENTPSQVKDVPELGRYREAGLEKWDRYHFEVNISGADGSPVMLEVTWPDDRERAMSFYMYPKSATPLHRERLSGGVQCGGEYPVSGKMQTTRYLFYPTEENYLFEIRTLVPGLPAAAAKLELYRLAERLPKLALDLPAGMQGRALGHLDEDQSFEVLFGGPQDPGFKRSDLPYGYSVQVFERLLDYMDYTGQDVMSYCLVRYFWSHLDDGPVNDVGDNTMRSTGWINLMLDMMQRRDKQLIAGVNIWTVPQKGINKDQFEKRLAEGYFATDRNGKSPAAAGWDETGLGNNPSHPAVRGGFLKLISEMLRRYGKHPAFKGIDLWCGGGAPFLYESLDYGYDDVTIAAFERETNILIPAATTPEERFSVRYKFLTGPQRAQWLAWRTKKNLELLSEVDRLAQQTRPDLKVYINISGWYSQTPEYLDMEQSESFDFNQFTYENVGLNFTELKKLPSIVLVPLVDATYYRWLKHWYGGRENVTNELNHDIAKFKIFRNGERSATSIYLRYFESFMQSMKQDAYQAYFQNSDPKAHGRYFLQDFAVALAAQDSSQILIGAQPLGTTGRDVETREFANAYRALPVGDFQDINGMNDPVTARYLNTKAGTYLYAVNLLWTQATARIVLPANVNNIMDLSTGELIGLPEGRLEITLEPFQLRSFRLVDATVKPVSGRAVVPASTRQWYAAQMAELEKEIASLAQSGADVKAYEQRFTMMKQAVNDGCYAEVHRLLFSKLIREIPQYRKAAADGTLKNQAEMIARSEYAIDCGSQEFYRSKSGRLFFPDSHYTPGGYGYDGTYQSVGRSIAGLTGSEDAALFATEAYDLDAYRFTVKPGKYTVRLYLKVGYEPGAKPGAFVLNADIEGQRLMSDLDLFVAGGSVFTGAVVREFNGVEVNDGVLDIEFNIPPGGKVHPTARLCDAIEVLPE